MVAAHRFSASGERWFLALRPPQVEGSPNEVWFTFVPPYLKEGCVVEVRCVVGETFEAARPRELCRSVDGVDGSLHINWPLYRRGERHVGIGQHKAKLHRLLAFSRWGDRGVWGAPYNPLFDVHHCALEHRNHLLRNLEVLSKPEHARLHARAVARRAALERALQRAAPPRRPR